MKINIAIKLDLMLALLWLAVFGIALLAGLAVHPLPFLLAAAGSIIIAHVSITRKILHPLQKFIEIADKVADGDVTEGLEDLRLSDLEEVQGSFTKIVGSLIESRVAIEDYMKTISEINKELEQKVDSLSVLYYASQSMGGSLNVDTLVRNFITIFTDRLGVSGAGVMLYNEKTDLVSVKDLIGISPELFAKFRFYSDNQILARIFSDDGYWRPTDQEINLLVAEFESDEMRRIKLLFPMRIKDHFVGLLLLTDKNGSAWSPGDFLLIQAIVGLASTSINNAMLFENSEATKNELDHKVFNLMTLQQSSKVLSSTLDLNGLINISIDMFLETVWANKGILMLFSDERPELEVKAFKGITKVEVDELKKNPAETWAMTTIEKEKKPIFAQEIAGRSYQAYTTVNRDLPFAVYVPMLKEGELYGVVKVGAKINGQPFTENDLEFFATLASQAVIAFENARLYSLAITDSITKLYVHRYFQMRLEEEVARSRRYNSTISLLMCDIDHFKPINDNYGHQQGDAILKEVSKILRKNVRNTDIAARYGGEEFAIILPETTQADAKVVAERIRRDVAHFDFPSIMPGQPSVKCSISIGVAGFPLNADNKDQLIQKADNALYKAKDSGRNKVVLCGID
ncbi:MAG TPA: diguanylate cyclase [Candidatus Rifleibacterium sp.]|nr:diguanylate cyclase [Candidatus Rifleibacterium sp.]HPT44980.1 diguanylate cyclase [Candidatus Rifleibacterium sp.]